MNTRLGFDSKLLLPKNSDGKFRTKRKIENYKIGNEDESIIKNTENGPKKKKIFSKAMRKPAASKEKKTLPWENLTW